MTSIKRTMLGVDGKPAPVIGIINGYCKSGDKKMLGGTTFRHIVKYLSDEPDALDESDIKTTRMFGVSEAQLVHKMKERLSIACDDFDYTLPELDALKAEGKTSIDVAKEICDRHNM